MFYIFSGTSVTIFGFAAIFFLILTTQSHKNSPFTLKCSHFLTHFPTFPNNVAGASVSLCPFQLQAINGIISS